MTIIIGKRSNLSQKLMKELSNVVLLSSSTIESELKQLQTFKDKSFNIIFNNFQTASHLNDLSSPREYIEKSIGVTAKVLDYIKEHKIKVNKIIYTSSSSVYGNNILCSENDILQPLNLHASLKVSNEKLIEKFSKDNKIDYTLLRVFNMYGGNDSFSIVSKIINAYKEKKVLQLVNNGNGIRDYIHIDDVVYIYKKVLNIDNISILNLGTGEGTSLKNILDYLRNQDILIELKSIEREELKISTSNNKKLISLLGEYRFRKIEKYILERIFEK